MKIIPAIDVIDGKCVRLTKGDYSTQKTYSENPLEVAKAFEDHGIKHLHLVDLDGAKSQHIVNHKILETLATKTTLSIDFGGGLKSDEDLRIAFECGAKQITGGSIAVKSPETFLSWVERYGANKIILGADVKGEYIATNGWTETTNKSLFSFLEFYQAKGVDHVICTDISKDGMLNGPAFDLYTKIIADTNYQLIASGGISTIKELPRLAALGLSGTIIGKAIYEKKITLKQLEQYISKN